MNLFFESSLIPCYLAQLAKTLTGRSSNYKLDKIDFGTIAL